MVDFIARANAALLRPFRARVDVENVLLLLALVLVISGGWHMVLNRIEVGSE